MRKYVLCWLSNICSNAEETESHQMRRSGEMVSWNENAKREQEKRGQRAKQPVRNKDTGGGRRLIPSVPLRRPAR